MAEIEAPYWVQTDEANQEKRFALYRSPIATMKTRIAALAAALVLGVAPISSAMAFERPSRYTTFSPSDVETTGSLEFRSVAPLRNPYSCTMSSAAEGNANQQNFPTQQYGQTSGGNRC
jgi:hypothetical protein